MTRNQIPECAYIKPYSLFCVAFLSLLGASCYAQIVPDLTSGDYFLPHLNEVGKQDVILKAFEERTKASYPSTSQELYPELYKYSNKDPLGPLKGTSVDPANAIKDYSKNSFQTKSSNSPPPQIAYNNSLSTVQRTQAIIEADLAAYEAERTRKQQLMDQISKDFGPTINYHLGLFKGPAVDRYSNAYSQLEEMLAGKQETDFLKAVWLVENAFDSSLSWDEFSRMFGDGLKIIAELMKQDRLSPNDNLAKIMSIYKFMADTTSVFIASKEKTIVSKPMLYDYEDYGGKNDPTKVFVSKLMRTGTGQCMSLPMLYYLYAKALKADVYLAFAPEHSYITFKDHFGNWQSIELTGRMFTTPDFYWQTGFIKTEQVKSGIYLTPISEKETLTYLLTTLGKTYVKKFGVDERLHEIAMTAKKYHPNSLCANMLLLGYSHELWKHVVRQYKAFSLSDHQLQTDQNAQLIKNNKDKCYEHLLKDLGYSKIPDFAYQAWLKSVNEMANQRKHIVNRRQLEQQLRK